MFSVSKYKGFAFKVKWLANMSKWIKNNENLHCPTVWKESLPLFSRKTRLIVGHRKTSGISKITEEEKNIGNILRNYNYCNILVTKMWYTFYIISFGENLKHNWFNHFNRRFFFKSVFDSQWLRFIYVNILLVDYSTSFLVYKT